MTDEQLDNLLQIASTETLLLMKLDYLTALLVEKMSEEKYINFEKKVNSEIYSRMEKEQA